MAVDKGETDKLSLEALSHSKLVELVLESRQEKVCSTHPLHSGLALHCTIILTASRVRLQASTEEHCASLANALQHAEVSIDELEGQVYVGEHRFEMGDQWQTLTMDWNWAACKGSAST
jgi:hypothetical protein